MSEFKSVGLLIGKGLGKIIGEPIKYVGDKIDNSLLSEIGDGIKKASSTTGETTGAFVGGAFHTVSGYVRNDEQQKQEGLEELVESSNRTVKGMGEALVQTWNQGEDVYNGFVQNDEERMLKGARGIVKTAAIASLAVGTFEIVDGIDSMSETVQAVEHDINESQTVQYAASSQPEVEYKETSSLLDEDNSFTASDFQKIETINDELEGARHSETDVPFVRDTVHLSNGEIISGVYPDFDEEYSATISQTIYLSSDAVQFDNANEQLAYEIQQDSELMAQFTPEQILQIQAGETPDGYVWHHHQEPGRLELVDEETHAQTGHSGGRSLWGGGSQYR